MKIALVQSPLAWGELQENLQNFDKKMAECEDCDVILLPEYFMARIHEKDFINENHYRR